VSTAVIPERFTPVLAELAPLAHRFATAGHRLYLVGGAVRDLLLDEPVDELDFDLTTDARPPEIKRCLAGWAHAIWEQGERFGTIGARHRDRDGSERTYEITTFRADVYADDSRKPQVTFSDRIEDDLGRRDFTINAIALEVTGGTASQSGDPTLVDPYGGAADLAGRVLRTPLAPQISFGDDPLRMLRAARFVARFGLEPDADLVGAVVTSAERLAIVSAERIRDELDKLLVVDRPSAGLWFCVDTGLAEHFLPELPALRLEHDPIHRHKDVLSHTIAVVENVRPPAVDDDGKPAYDFRITRLAALFHDVGKPRTRGYQPGKGTTFHHHDAVGARMTRKRMEALRYPTADVEAVSALVALHLRFHTYRMGWTDSAVRRYVRDAGVLLAELNVLTTCDCTTRDARKAATLARRMDELEARIEELAVAEELAAIRPELDGNDVMEVLGVGPSKLIGEALAFLLDVRLDEGLIGRDAAADRLRAWYAARE
jgi:poly(A) polymerase